MSDRLKRQLALVRLSKTGIWRSNYAPPFVRMLWSLGFDVPPPHYATFWGAALVAGSAFSAGYGLLIWLLVWSPTTMSFRVVALRVIVAGLLFGLCMAAYYYYGRKKHNLPSWNDLSI